MIRRLRNRRAVVSVCFFACVVGLSLGLTCPFGGPSPYDPIVASANRSPRVVITSLSTPKTPEADRYVAEPGEPVTISFSGEDAEDIAVVRLFASTNTNPSPAQEIPIMDGYPVGPGAADGTAVWTTTDVTAATYYIFAEIDDRTYDPADGSGNPAVRVTYRLPVEVALPGTKPLSNPPKLQFVYPRANLGLSSEDEVTIRYLYNDLDTPVQITLLLDTDLNPTNDDIDAPGDPLDPNAKIIILPSEARKATDPNYAGIRTNPRDLPATTATNPWVLVEYRFTINFDQIPVRAEPYHIRATISDESNTIHAYTEGQITISALASGTVDTGDLGFKYAGARFHGFSEGENLGTDFVATTDLDGDGPADFMIAGRFASPRNRYQSGAAYLLFGRSKIPFPPDTNDNGLPDTTDANGNVVDFSEPPAYYPDPYDPSNVGRFGGTNNINSVNVFFRGAIYGMPAAHSDRLPPTSLLDPSNAGDALHLDAHTGGLTSITRFDINQDDIKDLVFGLPFVSNALDYADDDPADGCEVRHYRDSAPNAWRCTPSPANNDDLAEGDAINQGLVIMVDARNDINVDFRLFLDAAMAGQWDPGPHRPVDDEGFLLSGAEDIPMGTRLRGAWWDAESGWGLFGWNRLREDLSDCCTQHDYPGCDSDDCEDAVCSQGPLAYCCEEDGPGWDRYCAEAAEWACDQCNSTWELATFTSTTEYGRTVSTIAASTTRGEQLLISIPGYDPGTTVDDVDRGCVQVWGGNNFLSGAYYGDSVMSLPSIRACESGACDSDAKDCCRTWQTLPNHVEVFGKEAGDRLGYAAGAGDINQDGTQDMAVGAPGADRNGRVDCGVVYIIMLPVGAFGDIDLSQTGQSIERVEVIGNHAGDRFGEVQTGIGDVSRDTISDVAFASESYDGPNGADSGYVGVIFGKRDITGEDGFTPEEVGTPALSGVRFYGAHAGARAGHDVASAGDFNGDGVGDILITSPGERRQVDVQSIDPNTGLPITVTETRVGVAYLIFGGQHLVDPDADVSFNLTEVGTTTLPGIVFISRFAQGTQDEAPIETAAGIGDIDGDGFDDIILGAPHADFVYSSSPNQRRLDAGEAYIVYGSNYGSNRLNQ